jgi:muramoyltetrapeptide carboxypeptidase
VRLGDRVGVAALSGPVDPARLEAGLAALRELGLEPVPARNLLSRSGLFAGDDAERLAAFHELAADPGLRAIFFARGGHGLLRLLPDIDWELLARHPRAYVGYSDLTPLLNLIVERLGLVAFHGPMAAADLARGLDTQERASLLAALAGELPASFSLEQVRAAGPVEGVLRGGCLSILVATLGTPFAPRLAGSLLVLEDIGEPLYRLDRMLTHLRLSGTLQRLGGLIFGHLTGTSREASELDPIQLAASHLPPELPIATGLRAGHEPPNLTLPLGLRARLEPGSKRLIAQPTRMSSRS